MEVAIRSQNHKRRNSATQPHRSNYGPDNHAHEFLCGVADRAGVTIDQVIVGFAWVERSLISASPRTRPWDVRAVYDLLERIKEDPDMRWAVTDRKFVECTVFGNFFEAAEQVGDDAMILACKVGNGSLRLCLAGRWIDVRTSNLPIKPRS
jgi:hypothetical protein